MSATITACPECHARTEEEAATMCRPGGPDGDWCPMTEHEDWADNLRQLNEDLAMREDPYWDWAGHSLDYGPVRRFLTMKVAYRVWRWFYDRKAS